MCLRRKLEGCVDCEKFAIEVARKHCKNLNGNYVPVNGFDGEPDVSFRSVIDILRGVCDYCNHDNWERCNGCMWANGNGDEDHWTFDERLLTEKE